MPIPNTTMLIEKLLKHFLVDHCQAVNKPHNTAHMFWLYFKQRPKLHNKGTLYMIVHP